MLLTTADTPTRYVACPEATLGSGVCTAVKKGACHGLDSPCVAPCVAPLCLPQVFILDSLGRYTPTDAREAETIIERVIPRLNHQNPAVVLSAVKIVVK